MNCDEALLAISAALDGELSPRERAALSEHLLDCPGCRELAADLRVLTEELERGDREPPEELAAAIRNAVAEEAKASPAPKKRRAPYLRTVAAMLALCVCLGGIGLFAAGRMGMKKGDAAGGAAPALYQAAPESREYDSAAPDGAEGAAEFSAASEGGPETPMESAAPQDPADAPLPMPSVAPSSGSAANGGTGSDGPEEAAPGMSGAGADSGSAEEKSALTPEEALELAFEYVGGYGAYPEAVRRTTVLDGAQRTGYSLKTVETETARSEYCLHYAGLSADGESYRFRLYEDITGKADGSGHTATMNWIDVSVDGGRITPMS